MLITFGDGWTLGDGSFYKVGMPELVYDKLKESEEYKNSWRHIVADHLKVKNINFAVSKKVSFRVNLASSNKSSTTKFIVFLSIDAIFKSLLVINGL